MRSNVNPLPQRQNSSKGMSLLSLSLRYRSRLAVTLSLDPPPNRRCTRQTRIALLSKAPQHQDCVKAGP
ncbi:hypothetical protein CSUI_004327 [Cystoisospora suis]|uniref:Uncharacterized protein n=1 Tax=Cystoisospora suis TaxID=483139 RepID=A0A2C6L1K4_9APIC|nr:hypothetical protein CSUI_004327 [Cystoisospora suis]